MMRWFIVVALTLLPVYSRLLNAQERPRIPTKVFTPADAMQAACKDIQTLPQAIQGYTRYLDMRTIPPEKRREAWCALSTHVNGLSHESDLVPPAVILESGRVCAWPAITANDFPQVLLVRLNIFDYGWDKKIWDSLGDVDPYYHAKLVQEEQEMEWYGYPDGKGGYSKDRFQKPTGKKSKKTVTAQAPWLSETPEQKMALGLLVQLSQSSCPLVSAPWFYQQTVSQVGRKPGYYDFLGVKNQKEFEQRVGFDRKASQAFSREVREAVSVSTVTLNPRAIARFTKLAGGFWQSIDVKEPTDKKNPLRVLGGELEFDATEIIAGLPNGIIAWYLADNKGVAQESAPDSIASDSTSPGNDRRVSAGISCIRCHPTGINEISGWVRGNVFSRQLVLSTPDLEKARELRQQYARSLDPFILSDRQLYADAIFACNGMTPAQNSAAHAYLWQMYVEARITTEYAARDLGVTQERLIAAIDKQLKANAADLVLSTFVVSKDLLPVLGAVARSQPIPVKIWEESYGLAQLAIRGYGSYIAPNK